MAFVTAKTWKFQTEDDIVALVGTAEELFARIERQKRRLIGMTAALQVLQSVGDALRVDLASAGHNKHSKPVLLLVPKYQDLMREASLACRDCVTSSLAGLNLHKKAGQAAQEGHKKTASKKIKQCSEMASKMAKASDALVRRAGNLTALAEQTLAREKSISAEERERLMLLIHQTQVQTKDLQTKMDDLADGIDMASAVEVRHAKTAEAKRRQATEIEAAQKEKEAAEKAIAEVSVGLSSAQASLETAARTAEEMEARATA